MAGQTLRLAEERTPDSATAKIREIINERQKVAEKKTGGKTQEKVKSDIKKSLEEKINKTKIKKYNWDNFVKSIIC